MSQLSSEKYRELVMFVLDRTPIWFFNIATHEYSVQKLYARCKNELMSTYPDIMNGNLSYAIIMCDAFREYQVDEIKLKEIRFNLNKMKDMISFYKKCRPMEYEHKVDEYNSLTDEYNRLLLPQNQLIKLYKSLQKKKNGTTYRSKVL